MTDLFQLLQVTAASIRFWNWRGHPPCSPDPSFPSIIPYQSINKFNKFISRHSTEACATVRLCRIKEKCLNTDLKCVNGWSSSTVQWKRVPKSRSNNREMTSIHTSDIAHRQHLWSAGCRHLFVPRHWRLMFGRRAFSVAGPVVWNSLPDYLRDPTRSSTSFCFDLKTFLFSFY